MRTERELVVEISRIRRESRSFEEAIQLAQTIMAAEFGGSALLVDPVEKGISAGTLKSISAFLDSRQFPFRALYTVPLTAGSASAGRLFACFGSFDSPGEILQRLTEHLAAELGEILARTRGVPRPEAA